MSPTNTFRGAGMKWWERSPSTNVALCCWFDCDWFDLDSPITCSRVIKIIIMITIVMIMTMMTMMMMLTMNMMMIRIMHCFYWVVETWVGVWENEKCCGNTSSGRVFPQLFRVLPNVHECLYNSIETRSACFLFLLENTATRKKTTC